LQLKLIIFKKKGERRFFQFKSHLKRSREIKNKTKKNEMAHTAKETRPSVKSFGNFSKTYPLKKRDFKK